MAAGIDVLAFDAGDPSLTMFFMLFMLHKTCLPKGLSGLNLA